MSNARPDPSIADRSHAPRGPRTQTTIRMAAALATSAVAIVLFGRHAVHPVEAALLTAVLVAAAGYGLIAGLLASVAAFVAYRLLAGAAGFPTILSSQDTVILAMTGCAVAAAGLYTDLAKQREKQARYLLDAGRPAPHPVGHPTALAPPAGKGAGTSAQPSWIALSEAAQRGAAAVGIIAAGLAGAVLLRNVLDQTSGALVVLASVLVVAGILGARIGFATGGLVGLALPLALSAAPPNWRGPAFWNDLFEAVLFAGLGWGVGVLSDHLRGERAALRTLVRASRDFSTGIDEAAIRRVLGHSLSLVAGGGPVQVFDENETLCASASLDAAALRGPPPEGAEDRWRTQRLAADGRDVGQVRWRPAGAAVGEPAADEIALALIELGASAIVRTRLSVEKAEMEFVTRAEHLRTVLLDAISHHFRSPLAGILGSVTSILNLPEPRDRTVERQLLLIIKEQANRLGRYVDNFLSLARLETESIEINLAEINLDSLIYDVWETFGEVGSARRYLEVELDPDPIRSDPNLLGQVFGNLLENAIKFSPEESVVSVRGRREGARLLVEVADQGGGVPAASQKRMFERFYRSQGAQAPGLGLGLYITRSLVEMLGGSVAAHNRSDGGPGLVVSVELPLSDVSP